MNAERPLSAISGYPMLLLGLVLLALAIFSFLFMIRTENLIGLLPLVGGLLLGILTLVGLFIVNPNDARVLILFGIYKGIVSR